MKYIFSAIFLLYFSAESSCSDNSDLAKVLSLTSNFFDNLNSFGENLDDHTQNLIDRQINHYVNLVKRTHGLISKSKSRRSIFNEDIDVLSSDFIGVYVLNGFFEQTRIPVVNPVDITLFKHDFGSTEIWYAAVLQNNNLRNKEADRFVIYRFEEENYIPISNISVSKGTKIITHSTHGIIHIIIAENCLKPRVAIFHFDIHENLYNIGTINDVNPTDIATWQQNDLIYLAIVQEKTINSDSIYYETKSLIFTWVDKNFQLFQSINTKGAREITYFQIGDEQFLFVVNNIDDKGETDIFSEVFKYDTQSHRFLSHQQILTHAAVDVKYFCFTQNELHEHFLIVANSYETDTEGEINYETYSIMYKYVEDYFIPFQSFTLNYAERWLPVIGPNGEFILMVSLKYDGIKIFQYDGWRFVESEVQYTGESFGPGIRSFGSYLYNFQPVIVVANENDYGEMLNVFSPTFNYQNIMNELQMDTLDWCQQITKDFETEELRELNRLVEEAPKYDDLEIQLNGKLFFHNVTIYNLVIDDDNANRNTEKSVEYINLEKQIDKRSEQLKQLDTNLKNSEPLVLNGDVRVKTLEISDDRIVFEDMHVNRINSMQIDEFLNDIINIEDEFSISDDMFFDDIIFDGFIAPKFINNIPKNALLHKDSNLSVNNDLIVHGNVIVDNLIVDGFLEGIKIDEKNILLSEGDQILEGTLLLSELKTENLEVDYLNNIDMINLQPNKIINVTEQKIETLTVKNVTVNYINGMNMDIFHNLVLRTRGDQEIISDYEFETLIVDEIVIDGLVSETNISQLALISGTTNLILQPVYFTEDLRTDHLYVINSINQIPVYDGKLDVLLRDQSKMQYVNGNKTFENINLIGPIELRGHIDIKGLDPPIISKNVNLTGDYTIDGDVFINKLLKFEDLTEPNRIYSFERLANQGLKLNDTEIPNHLVFNQELSVDRIDVDKINGIDVDSWIVFEDDPPEITGTKIFEEELNINGELTVLAINGENLEDLYNNILRIDSDQIITGRHSYSSVTAVRVVSNETTLNGIAWDKFMTIDGDQFIEGTTILSEPVKMSQFEANSAKIGKIQNIDFDEMIADTAFNDTENIVIAPKYFESDVFFQYLDVDFINDASLQKFLNEINQWLGDVHINESIDIEYLEAGNVFCEEINGIEKRDFGKVWLLKEGRQTIFGDQYFGNVNCKNINIDSNMMNDINLSDFYSQAVKTYEDHKFNSVHFAGGFESATNVKIDGKINNININDAVLTEGLDEQTIQGVKTIDNNVTVEGLLRIDGLLSGVNLTLLHELTKPNDHKNMKLIVDGNINFKHEFDVRNLNDINIEKLAQNAWYKNEPAAIEGTIMFEDLIFEDDLQVDNLVDGVPLVWLSKNYFSKTKDQNISAHLNFVDGVVFAKNIEAETAEVLGKVANISIQDFNHNILRSDDQIFNIPVQFEDVEVKGKFDAKLINNLNLSTDVLRNDVMNFVTGEKTIENLNAITFDIAKGKKLQNVDLDDWFQNAVFLDGKFEIEGLKIIKNAKFEQNIHAQSLVNSHIFDENHILLTNVKQNITGKKTFITSGALYNSSLKFDNLKLNGLYNNVVIEKLFDSQIDKSKDVVQISAVKNFYNTLEASEVIIDNLYQGIKISKLIENITDLENLNTFAEEYNRLHNYAKEVLVVLDQQSHYLNTFKQIQKFEIDLKDILVLQDYDDSFVAFVSQKRNSVIISPLKYETKSEQFEQLEDISFETKKEITYTSQISFNNKLYLYLEQKSNSNPGHSHLGTMYTISTTKRDIGLSNVVQTNKTNSIISFTKPSKENCLFVIGDDNIANIFCNLKKNIFELEQQIIIANDSKVSAITIENIPYIFIINRGENLIDSTLQILKFCIVDLNFKWHQIFGISEPSSIDSIYYNNNYYLTISIRHNIESEDPGHILIYKHDIKEDLFTKWQKISVIDPVGVKFAILSSDELVLQILSTCPGEPYIVYLYEGISGFTRKYSTSAIPLVSLVNNFVVNNTDFVFVSNGKEVRIFEAVYNGKKYN